MLHPRLPAALLSLRQNPWSRRVLRAGAALLLLWLVAWLAVPPALRWGIERLGSQALGRSVAVGSVDFRPWSLELTLHELAVGAAAPGAADSGPQGANALPPQFTVDRVYLERIGNSTA